MVDNITLILFLGTLSLSGRRQKSLLILINQATESHDSQN
jgi:hypothetical protein